MSNIKKIENLTEIKKILWNGSINLKITHKSSNENIEFLIQVYRNSYLPFIYEQIITYFKNFLSTNDVKDFNKIWLEYENVPLKWNYPSGVLYDYLYLPGNFNNQQHIWNLDLKFETADQKYPSDYIIPTRRFESDIWENNLNEILVNQLKQSCFVINGTSKPIMQLSEQNSKNLWKSIKFRNLNEFSYVNKKILKQVKNIPIKLIVPSDAGNVIQVPGSPLLTLKEFLKMNCSNLYDISIPVIQGIDVTSLLDLQLIEIWELFKHLDNVLYITNIIKS
ncbi:ATG5 [Candida jiufengensis]|uniref:ATG5 n=1 Tax=Candida jiufengensis TaxID=497108 RepID=UPI00222406ED|nr:ATG5 [Candida jiufengensis]KAI5953315.1 ATG5 [Candida jiufengensis]